MINCKLVCKWLTISLLTVSILISASETQARLWVTVSGPGAGPGDTVYTGESVTFNIHLGNETEDTIIAMNHGFRMYSPDGASWSPPVYEENVTSFFDAVSLDGINVDGTGADTIGLGAIVTGMAPGIPNGYDDIILTITTIFPHEDSGKSVFLDSCWFPPTGEWGWQTTGGEFHPAWEEFLPRHLCFDFVLCGYKYEDIDGDGVMTGNDVGLSGWTINMYESATTQIPYSTLTTDATGAYCFHHYDFPPSHSSNGVWVGEELKPYWKQSTPDPNMNNGRHHVFWPYSNPGPGGPLYNFGNDSCRADTVLLNTGYNLHDDALYQIGEPVPYWIVTDDPDPGTNEDRPSWTIQKNGAWWGPLPNSQWISSYPSANNDLNGSYWFKFCFCLESGFTNPVLNIDVRADDSAVVYLNRSTNPFPVIGVVPFPGFNTNPATNITVTDPNMFQVGENCLEIMVENVQQVAMGLNVSGDVTVDANKLLLPWCCADTGGTIMGTKWLDTDGDCVIDPGEPPLSGWTIEWAINSVVYGQTTTDVLGNYYFINVPFNTNLTIQEQLQSGYMQTCPTWPGTHSVTVDLNKIITDIDFGNIESGLIDTCDNYKLPYPDYAPNGVPDFDQKQDESWKSPSTGNWSWCGPVALANCLWWFDSKFEPNPLPPSQVDDNYPLVPVLGGTDDHTPDNVHPLISDLEIKCNTDNTKPGTDIYEMQVGFHDWLTDRGLRFDYTSYIPEGPGHSLILDSIESSQNVILLLGFYEINPPGDCKWLGGHYVTSAGLCWEEGIPMVCISDPYFDKNESEPPSGTAHDPFVHNDAKFVSGPHGTIHHDKYTMLDISTSSPYPCNIPADAVLLDYPNIWTDVKVFKELNYSGAGVTPTVHYSGGDIVVAIDAALIICPAPTCDYQKQPYEDYAPTGMPDFDQKQLNWKTTDGDWSYDGPVSLANCFWWFDSKFEPNPIDPRPFGSGANDGYNLVTNYGAAGIDDHDPSNVPLLVDFMASTLNCSPSTKGTLLSDLTDGASAWLTAFGLKPYYTINTVMAPEFEDIQLEVLRSQNVILLLGFYEQECSYGCNRLGGHYVTVAGVCDEGEDWRLCISDPYFDRFESGPPPIHGSTVHNDAEYISGPHGSFYHDGYPVHGDAACTGDLFYPLQPFLYLEGYPCNDYSNIDNFYGLNLYDPLCPPKSPYATPHPIRAYIDAAIIICPDSCENQDIGDFNGDGIINLVDIFGLNDYVRYGGDPPVVWANADFDGNCKINTKDVMDLQNYYFNNTPEPAECTCVLPALDFFNCGDANGDGQVNIGDAVFLINYIFNGGSPPEPIESGDANCDMFVNIGDAVYLINFIFKGGDSPCANCP